MCKYVHGDIFLCHVNETRYNDNARKKEISLAPRLSARLRRLASRPAHAPAAYLFGTHSDTRQRRRPLSLCDSPRTAASIAAASSPAACAAGASPTALLCCLPLLPPHSLLSPYTVCSGAPRAPIQCPHQPARPHQHRPHQPHGPLLRVSSPATSGPSHQHRAPLIPNAVRRSQSHHDVGGVHPPYPCPLAPSARP